MRKLRKVAVFGMTAVLTASMSMPVFAAEGFDAAYYAAQNPDVVAVIGNDAAMLETHYETYGKAEGRKASAGSAVSSTANLSAVFDAAYYAAQNPDVVAVFGTDALSLYTHYITLGIYEGRNGSASFNAKAYKEANPDLVAVYGDDLAAYATHYATVGQAEGRNTGKSTAGNTTSNPYARFVSGGGGGSSSHHSGSSDNSADSSQNAPVTHVHTSQEVAKVPATCTEKGTEAGTKCSVCGAILSGCEEIPLADHTSQEVAEVPATCTEKGTKAGTKCSECGAVLSGCEEIPLAEHTYDDENDTICGYERTV